MIRDRFGVEADTNGPPVDAVGEAGAEVSQRLSWGRDPDQAYAQFWRARDAMLEDLAPLINEAGAALPARLRTYIDRATANAGLDSPYRLLDLTAVQREQIGALQRERDRVLRDARQRHRLARLEAARETFEAAVVELLDAEQQAELAQFQANIAANLEAGLDRELADYPIPDPTDDAQASRRRNVAPQRQGEVLTALASLGRRLLGALEKLASSGAAAPSIRASLDAMDD